MSEVIYPPVPENISVDGWGEVTIRKPEDDESLVALGPFSEYWDIWTSSLYPGEHSNSPYGPDGTHLSGALITQFVRSGVAGRLRTAQSLLPENHSLVVFDAYRPLAVQRALYEHYVTSLRQLSPDWTQERIARETQKYVSLPSQDVSRPSPHNTGGAVDLAIFKLPPAKARQLRGIDCRLTEIQSEVPISYGPADEAYNPILRELYLLEMSRMGLIRRHAELLDFGTPFDYGGEAAASSFLEAESIKRSLSKAETRARLNRRILATVMGDAGFSLYPPEWWHYNAPESQMGAIVAGRDNAEYGAVDLSRTNIVHEEMRSEHYRGTRTIFEAISRGVKLRGHDAVTNALVELNELALSRTGDPCRTALPKAAIIEASR